VSCRIETDASDKKTFFQSLENPFCTNAFFLQWLIHKKLCSSLETISSKKECSSQNMSHLCMDRDKQPISLKSLLRWRSALLSLCSKSVELRAALEVRSIRLVEIQGTQRTATVYLHVCVIRRRTLTPWQPCPINLRQQQLINTLLQEKN